MVAGRAYLRGRYAPVGTDEWRAEVVQLGRLDDDSVFAALGNVHHLIHIALIESGTLIVMPILQVLLGLLFDIAIVVALYAWTVSWEP